jgi:asparagine synthase (glutamine-hydrolysing)
MPTLLDRKDRMSMACGLEVRVPFADHKLLEYVWNIPWKIKNYGNQSKGILRRALRDVLPEDVLQRPKSPYPKTHHPQYMRIVRDRVLNILGDNQSPLADIVNTAQIKARLTAGQEVFPKPWFGQLMGDAQYLAWLIQLDHWMREYRVIIA